MATISFGIVNRLRGWNDTQEPGLVLLGCQPTHMFRSEGANEANTQTQSPIKVLSLCTVSVGIIQDSLRRVSSSSSVFS